MPDPLSMSFHGAGPPIVELAQFYAQTKAFFCEVSRSRPVDHSRFIVLLNLNSSVAFPIKSESAAAATSSEANKTWSDASTGQARGRRTRLEAEPSRVSS